MSFDLIGISSASVITPRERAIYRDALRADHQQKKINNLADLLERGPRARAGHHTALVIDIKA